MSVCRENANIRDNHRRLLAEKFELRRNLYKALCKDTSLPDELREENRYKLSKLPRNSSFTRIRNRCIFSGRGRAVYETFRMSRIASALSPPRACSTASRKRHGSPSSQNGSGSGS